MKPGWAGRTLRVAAAGVIAALALFVASSARRSRDATHQLHQARWVQAGGFRLRAVRAGEGRTVVLLHGFGESLMSWRGVLDRLATHADVIALDMPGFGLSTKATSGYSPDSLAATVLRALDTLGVQRAVIVGHSLGGAVAAAIARLAPARVEGLVLVDAAVLATPVVLPESPPDTNMPAPGLIAGIAEYEALRLRFTPVHDGSWMLEPDSASAAYSPAGDSLYTVGLQAVLREFDFASLNGGRAGQIAQRTLVIWGALDPLFSVSLGETLSARIPNAQLSVISRSWHRPHVERPERVAELIVQFLDTL